MTAEFRCADAGVACRKVTRADSEAELLRKVREHARDAHGVELNDTLLDYAASEVKTSAR
jgi:predicted small metal-binding protein